MNISIPGYRKFLNTWWLLRLTYGIMFILAGLDKLFPTNFIVQWTSYLSDIVLKVVPLDAVNFMRGIGIIEAIGGLLLLFNFVRFGAWILLLLVLFIAFNLVLTGIFFDIAVRDVAIAMSLLALAWLNDVKEEIEET